MSYVSRKIQKHWTWTFDYSMNKYYSDFLEEEFWTGNEHIEKYHFDDWIIEWKIDKGWEENKYGVVGRYWVVS